MSTFRILTAAALMTCALSGKTVQRPAGPSTKLTDATLRAKLASMGYQVEERANRTFRFAVERSDLRYNVYAMISNDRRYLYVTVGLLESKNLKPAVATRLMEHNFKMGLTYFGSDGNYVYLIHGLENDRVTAAKIRSAVDTILGYAEQTRGIWQASPSAGSH